MMKKFLLIVCGSFVGMWLAMLVFSFISILFAFAVIGMAASGGSKAVSEHSILHLNLAGTIEERASNTSADFVGMMQGTQMQSTGLDVIVAGLSKAKDDKNIDGLYIECEGVDASSATLKVIRDAVSDFKQSGKFVYAYADAYAQDDYYVASVADSIFLNPVGMVDIHGHVSAVTYPKRLLDKLGVEMQVLRVGTYKSAVEPYMVEEMSEANRMQTEAYLNNIWKFESDSMAASRKISPEVFNSLADSLVLSMPADSLVKNKLVDRLCYSKEMEDRLKALTKVKDDEELNLVSPSTLAGNLEEVASGSKVAVLYAEGEIDGAQSRMGQSTGIDSKLIVETVYDLIKDDDVKALVLRVNSPGGSAFGSEQMWKALDDFKKSGKPFVVSMGDYAASGGYYMSCGADRIFAEPTTLTGSIGIFGVIPCFQDLAENKLGVSTFIVKTNENADFSVSTKRMTPMQQAAMQRYINNGYELFTKRCADGRHVTQDSIKVIAEGRVWDGAAALKIGLVDEMGGLKQAIKWAADKAKLKDGDYSTQNYPDPNSEFNSLMKSLNAQNDARLKQQLGFFYDYYMQLTGLLNRDYVLCIMERPVIK
ncbi:MAG: signal peptide peptidase SppA [Muribaculaceae bacterium]|nr:signal peptide peptidase SppA [Muribaculaceae bacterium]